MPPTSDNPITVTRPSLPPLADFLPYLEKMWDSGILTNAGPFHEELESQLGSYLGVEHLSLFSNCTIGLVTALQALRITGEVITTPYSFVATAHSLLWNGLKPVFVDVEPGTLNMDPQRIEAAITPHTSAILPVHCYGTPCDTMRIQEIADNYGFKVLYDAAHAFGVTDAGGSVLRHGDLSVLSFHATKVFTTFEGGAIVSPDLKTKRRIDHLKNFGFADEVTVVAPGINGKMAEINAAFGLVQLQHIDNALARRAALDHRYRQALDGVAGIECLQPPATGRRNYSYFPILVNSGYALARDDLYALLKDKGFHARRYFWPLISDFPMYRHLASAAPANLPNACSAARRVICLPLYPDLAPSAVDAIVELIRRAG